MLLCVSWHQGSSNSDLALSQRIGEFKMRFHKNTNVMGACRKVEYSSLKLRHAMRKRHAVENFFIGLI
jgi:hypothetical protein